jgi:acetyl esterase/lipase
MLGIVVGTAAPAACAPPPPSSGPRPYLDPMYTNVSVTPQAQPLSYGAAPPIDPLSGPSDPFHRPLDASGNEIQRMWIADPVDNTATNRPAIVWVHGGGFKAGIGAAYSVLVNDGLPYAKRGYVGISVEYRIDTTSDCQYVQDHAHDVPLPADWTAKYAQCRIGIVAAQQDKQAAVRWVRRNAAQLHVDPNRVAVGGFSAGAVTAANVAYRSDDAGTWSYQPGDDPGASSKVQAAFGASGCEYEPATIGAGDAPISLIHSEFDQAVDYRNCVVPTVTTARAADLVAELTSYCGQNGHAQVLYEAHRAATDEQWTTFLVRELRIYSRIRPPSTDPVCP